MKPLFFEHEILRIPDSHRLVKNLAAQPSPTTVLVEPVDGAILQPSCTVILFLGSSDLLEFFL